MAGTPEDQIRAATDEARTKSLDALNTGQSESKRLTEQAQAAIKAQQQDALNRLLADAKTRGFTGSADTLQAEMVGPGDRRVESLSQGLGARDNDYEWRKSNLGQLYGRIEALAPQLGAQVLAARAGGGGGGGGRRGGGGGGGSSGGGSWSTQDDYLSEILDRLTQDDTDQVTMDYERYFGNLARLDPRGQEAGVALWRAGGGDLPTMMEKLAAGEGNNLFFQRTPRRGVFGNVGGLVRDLTGAGLRRNAVQRALDDAVRNRTRVTTKTSSRTQSTEKDKRNSRNRRKSSSPHRPSLRG
jgi:hypothetical protein